MPADSPHLPLTSLAIAGAWGYIGRKFLQAAGNLGLTAYVYDPGPLPKDVNPGQFVQLPDAASFYRQQADLFHLALHPEHRRPGLDTLLARSQAERIVILNEKPMATPEAPAECQRVIDEAERSGAWMLFDFPELFDHLTLRIVDFLHGFRRVRIREIDLCRSKDREDVDNPRNYKRMVPIEYQESVHCLAFALYLLASLANSLDDPLADGISAKATAEPYRPPNPEIYPYVVDGRCLYELALGEVTIRGETNFKSGARWTKSRVIRGEADGREFVIEANYLEGHKRLLLNGHNVCDDPEADSYEQAILRTAQWARDVPRQQLLTGVYPNPRFARLTYQLSSVLWRSAYERRTIGLSSRSALEQFDAGFAAELPRLARY